VATGVLGDAPLAVRPARVVHGSEPPASAERDGVRPGQFTGPDADDATLQEVKKDIDEAYTLGIYFTPMIFINGVELKGWNAPQALTPGGAGGARGQPRARAVSADRRRPRWKSTWPTGASGRCR